MYKTVLSVAVFGFLLSACGASDVAVPAATLVSPTSTAVTLPTAESIEGEVTEIKLETQSGTAYTLDWSSDGKILAAASGAEVTLISEDLKEILFIGKPEGGALGVTWNPEMTQFATVTGLKNPTITIWDWDSTGGQLTQKHQIQAGSDQYGVSWSPNGKWLATLGNDRQAIIQIWDTGTWQETHKYELEYTNPRRALRWSRDSTKVFGAGETADQVVIFAVNVTDGIVDNMIKFPLGQAEVFAVSPDETKVAIADAAGKVWMIDASAPKLLMEFQSVEQPVDMAWHPKGGKLAILDYKTKLQLWDVAQ